ncbi:MAG: sigma 54-interacting transcriptional regulator [Alicyclobacillus herbarius]|nr:sigma 54-interacting transcriptional regulator [Alicyclobacillus herbarius]
MRDIVSVLAEAGANVEAMEVVARVVYIRFRLATEDAPHVRRRMEQIPGVAAIADVDRLPFEQDEDRLVRRALLHEEGAEPVQFTNLVYASPAMARVVQLAKTVAPTEAPVLLLGETGTGKELLARIIHKASLGQGRFVPINCAAIPDALLESELFGYEDGAFTGARRGGRPGLFEMADGGTLFFDEIGEMNLAVQAKLLRALNDGEIRRVGALRARKVRARVIAATNRDLRAMVGTGQFRADLYYRLNVIPICIPPLRERPEDIAKLAEHWIARMSQRLNRTISLDVSAQAALMTYDFPGNVRELQNILERACYLAEEGVITARHLLLEDAQPSRRNRIYPGPVIHNDTVRNEFVQNDPLPGNARETSLKEQVQAFERALIQRVVKETGSIRGAARRLGVSHSTLLNKLRSEPESRSKP